MKGEIVFRAIEVAARAHAGQFRKQTAVPYIVHPLGVAKLLAQYGCRDEVVAAGILHDVVEDTVLSLEEIEDAFGAEVAGLVEGASEPDRSATWEERKEHTIEYLRSAARDVLIIVCADKLDNLRSIREDQASNGEEATWSRFNRPKESQRWYYRSLAEIFRGRLDQAGELGRLFHEFTAEVDAVFGA